LNTQQEQKKPEQPEAEQPETVETQTPETEAEAEEQAPQPSESPDTAALDAAREAAEKKAADLEDRLLRLAAEYDNFRKRSQKEKDSAWADAKAETIKAFLPVYDNLERALKQQTSDEAYAKGVEMTMAGLKDALGKLGVTEIPALDQPFDPNVHNAVMHIEDENVGENIITEVFQTGFQSGSKIIRFAMVKVAN